MVQLSYPYMTTGKTIVLTRWTFVGKVMSLLFNMLSSFVIAFPLRSKCLLISWLQSPSAVILEPKKIKSVTVSIFSPCICHEVMGPDANFFFFFFWRQHNGADLIQTCYMNYRVEVYYECVPDLEEPEITATKNCSFIVRKPWDPHWNPGGYQGPMSGKQKQLVWSLVFHFMDLIWRISVIQKMGNRVWISNFYCIIKKY